MTKHQRIECCFMSLLGLDKTADKAKDNLFSDCHLLKKLQRLCLFISQFICSSSFGEKNRRCRLLPCFLVYSASIQY